MDQMENIPVLYIRARNHYDMGYTIGNTFRGWIGGYMDTSNDVKHFRQFYNNGEGRKIVDDYISSGSKSHPNIMSEIRGMADGAEIKFEDLFLLQIASELQFCHIDEILKTETNQSKDGKGCTDVLVNRTQCRIMGHNDDWTAEVSSRVYIVHATITDEKGTIMEQFVSFSYPGYLAGFCFGMNKSLVITLNSLMPKRANRTGTPVVILLRSLLTCSTVGECVAAMDNTPFGCAYGMNINIARIHGSEMCSMEVYTTQGETKVQVHYIPHESESDEPCYYFHQNHYKHIQAEENDDRTGSRMRDQRTNEIPPPQNMDDVRAILGDTTDQTEPIYRVPRVSHYAPNAKTTATAIFDISNRLLHVYRANPNLKQADPFLTLPFL